MLSNLRFNVLASVDDNEASILLRLVPRTSRSGGLHFKLAREISFMLSLADINVFSPGPTQRTARVTLIERYRLSEKVQLPDYKKVHSVVLIR
jgi:hypothetical protein